ncbi:MAG: TlpA family protein disulfide reductase [Anaerolineales bacterium]|nr:TlpA family protein disulfide reductase [Anaerolineales bacterium]
MILLAGGAWIWFSRLPSTISNSKPITAPQETFLAPEFRLSTTDGDEISLSELFGSPVIVNFWASWCPPCRSEMPAFQQIYEEYEEKGLVIAAVNATNQDSISNAVDFVSTNNLTFPVLLDISGAASSSYNLHSLPTTFFIDSEGVIRKVIIGGPIPTSLIRVEIEKLFQE